MATGRLTWAVHARGFGRRIRWFSHTRVTAIPVKDFWDELRAVEQDPDHHQAVALRDRMLNAAWSNLSRRDSLEFFNELLRLEELFPGLLMDSATAVLERIRRDSRSGHRQDQISKAHLLHRIGEIALTAALLEIASNKSQDLDTRNAAIRMVWRRPDVTDAAAVSAVRSFLLELLPLANMRDEPASAFVVGLSYLLLSYGGCTRQDEAVARQVYGLWHAKSGPVAREDMFRWFRTQFTLGGLRPDAAYRG